MLLPNFNNYTMDSIDQIVKQDTVYEDDIKALKSLSMDYKLHESLNRLFELFDQIKNKNWIIIIFLIFITYHDKLYFFWSELLELIPSIDFDIETVKLCLDETFRQTSVSWIASTILESSLKENQHLRGIVNDHFITGYGMKKFHAIINENNDITSLINLTKSLMYMGCLSSGDAIEYLNNGNPTFKNVFQMFSVSCADIAELNLRFSNNDIILAQIFRNTLIVWNNDKCFYPINLSNLVNCSKKSQRTISLSFKKLSRFNTINHRLNVFNIEMCVKKNRLVQVFMNRLKNSQAIRLKRTFINIPLLISPYKATKLYQGGGSLEKISQCRLESPEKIITSKKVIQVNSSQKIVANIQDLDQHSKKDKIYELISSSPKELLEEYENPVDSVVQVPATQLSALDKEEQVSEEELELEDEINEEEIDKGKKTQYDLFLEITNSTEIEYGRRTRSGRVLPPRSNHLTYNFKRSPTEGDTKQANIKKAKLLESRHIVQHSFDEDTLEGKKHSSHLDEPKLTPPLDEGTLIKSSSASTESTQRYLRSQIRPFNLSASKIHGKKFEAIGANLADFTKTIVEQMSIVEDQIIERFNDLNEELEDSFQKIINQYGERIEQLNEYINMQKSGIFSQHKS